MTDLDKNFHNFRSNIQFFIDGTKVSVYDHRVPLDKILEVQRVECYVREAVRPSTFWSDIDRSPVRLTSYQYHNKIQDGIPKEGWYAVVHHGGRDGWRSCFYLPIPDKVISGAG